MVKLSREQLLKDVYKRLCENLKVDIGDFTTSEEQDMIDWYFYENKNFDQIIASMKKRNKVYYKSLKK